MNTLIKHKERNYLWDNIKTILIFMVVIAHFLGTFPVNDLISDGINYWINTFHMPAFLFVSGYLSKGFCKNGKVYSEKVAKFIAYYVVFQVIFYLYLKLFFTPDKTFSLFVPNIGLWYLASLIAFYLMIPLVERMPAYMFMAIVQVEQTLHWSKRCSSDVRFCAMMWFIIERLRMERLTIGKMQMNCRLCLRERTSLVMC